MLGLETYAHTVKCTANTEVFILDNKNIDRLIQKRNIYMLELLRQSVENKLRARFHSPLGGEIPLYEKLLKKAIEMRPKKSAAAIANEELPKEEEKEKEEVKREEAMFNQVIKMYMEDRGPLLQSSVPDSMYYIIKAREKARKERNTDEKIKKASRGASMEMRLQRARKYVMQNRQPRSRRELEKLTIANEMEQLKLQDQGHAINRYLVHKPNNARPSTANGHTQDEVSEEIFKLTEPDLGYGDEDDQIVLRPDDLQHDSVRAAVLKMARLKDSSNANRAKIICSMIERRQNQTPAGLENLLRPKSAPLGHKKGQRPYGADSDSDSEIGDFDYATSNTALNELEDKIRHFHGKFDEESGSARFHSQVPHLKRFNLQVSGISLSQTGSSES